MNATHPGVGTWIERWSRVHGDRVAIVSGNTRRTYAALASRVRRLAHGLRRLGVRRGDRIVWIGPNHPAFLETLFAATTLGAGLAPLNQRLEPDVLERLCNSIAPRVILVNGMRAFETAQLPCVVIEVSDEWAGTYEHIINTSVDQPIDEPVRGDDLCLLPFTSGTTGPPKGVMLTHANVTWNAVNAVSAFDIRDGDVTLAVAPFHRTGGTGAVVLPVLFRGGTVVVSPTTSPDDVLQLIERERITIGFTNPDLLDALRRSARWRQADLTSLRTLICGGAPVPDRLLLACRDRGLDVRQGYGLSEAAPLVAVLDADNVTPKIGSVGRPALFVDVRIAGLDGVDAAAGRIGELQVRGPNVMAGYWRRPDDTRRAVDADGWLRTGDAAYIDEDGFLFVVGRMADAYESDGETVHPGVAERVIMQHPSGVEACVIGRPDGAVAFVVVDQPADAMIELKLRRWCRKRLPAAARPRAIRIVDSLPRNSNGKILRPADSSRSTATWAKDVATG